MSNHLFSKSGAVPVLITWDIDPDTWLPPEKRLWSLNKTIELCQSLYIRATFFFTALGAELYSSEMQKLVEQGHEVGCHGLTHEDEENYDRMPDDMQRSYLKQATEKLSSLAGLPMRAFRSPRVKTSALTMQLLADNGYLSDSSVCSQRTDIVSSNLINFGWISAPRLPYHPNVASPFRAGNIPLWEIPVSAIGLPFISSTLLALGLPFMKLLFRLLLAEARRTGKPIVYLAHPVEFRNRPSHRNRFSDYFQPRYFSPEFIRTHGFRTRNWLYRMSGETLFSATQELFHYIATFPDVHFLSVSEYVMQLSNPGAKGLSLGK